MSEILLGTNRFVDCHTLLSVRGEPVLRIGTGPLRVTFAVPKGLPPGIDFEVSENKIARQPGAAHESLHVTAQDGSVAILWGQVALVLAVLTDPGKIHLRVDLRPIGMNLYDDAAGLHVAGNNFSGNQFSNCATAISLG